MSSGGYFDFDGWRQELATLRKEQLKSDFWSDQTRAKEISQKISFLAERLKNWEWLISGLKDLSDLFVEAQKEADASLSQECLEQFATLQKLWEKLKIDLFFSGKYDAGDALVSIHAGTGGVDAQDWSQMLVRMYWRYAEAKGWTARLLNKQVGQEAGLKSATFEVTGYCAYGWLKAESGVHRLVRISPFDAEKMRHTSFALVEVLPVITQADFVIDPADIRVDTFRSSGRGGQGVNTTDSAVRLTHLPTGVVVTCQNERSQQQNRVSALKILTGRVHYLEQLKQERHLQDIKGDYLAAQWGNQARSYVLQPYKQVKDHRTKFITADVQRVLDGDLDDLAQAWLRQQASLTSKKS